jgi:hypothetical protein
VVSRAAGVFSTPSSGVSSYLCGSCTQIHLHLQFLQRGSLCLEDWMGNLNHSSSKVRFEQSLPAISPRESDETSWSRSERQISQIPTTANGGAVIGSRGVA